MDQTQLFLFVAIAAVVIFVVSFLHQRKKKASNQLGQKLQESIKANDWETASRILLRQMIVWGIITILVMLLIILRLMNHQQIYSTLVFFALAEWNYYTSAKGLKIARKNQTDYAVEQESQEKFFERIKTLLKDCKVSQLDLNLTEEEVKNLWLEKYKNWKVSGYYPVLLESIYGDFFDYLDELSEWYDEVKLQQWRAKLLNSTEYNGQQILQRRFEELKESYLADGEEGANAWKELTDGEVFESDCPKEFTFFSTPILVEMPIKEPWQVFTYLSYGGWNECPTAEEHAQIARYWYESYGAVVIKIASDSVLYYTPYPPMGDTTSLAKNLFAYAQDTVETNLPSLASHLHKSHIWYCWWD